MSDIVAESETAAPAAATKVKIPVKTGHGEERVIELELGSRARAILEVIAAERGCVVEELVLFLEGDDEPLAEIILIDEGHPLTRRHHVHHAGAVEVTVYYQAGDERRRFKRSATVDTVLAWAIEVFKIDPSLATELALARHGQKEELPGSEHIGHLAGRHHELALDVVRGDMANGAAP